MGFNAVTIGVVVVIAIFFIVLCIVLQDQQAIKNLEGETAKRRARWAEKGAQLS